jgi:hypothetical protein
MATRGEAITFEIKKKKPNVRLNILDEGYPSKKKVLHK